MKYRLAWPSTNSVEANVIQTTFSSAVFNDAKVQTKSVKPMNIIPTDTQKNAYAKDLHGAQTVLSKSQESHGPLLIKDLDANALSYNGTVEPLPKTEVLFTVAESIKAAIDSAMPKKVKLEDKRAKAHDALLTQLAQLLESQKLHAFDIQKPKEVEIRDASHGLSGLSIAGIVVCILCILCMVHLWSRVQMLENLVSWQASRSLLK